MYKDRQRKAENIYDVLIRGQRWIVKRRRSCAFSHRWAHLGLCLRGGWRSRRGRNLTWQPAVKHESPCSCQSHRQWQLRPRSGTSKERPTKNIEYWANIEKRNQIKGGTIARNSLGILSAISQAIVVGMLSFFHRVYIGTSSFDENTVLAHFWQERCGLGLWKVSRSTLSTNKTCDILTLFFSSYGYRNGSQRSAENRTSAWMSQISTACEIVTEMTSNPPLADTKHLCTFFWEG